MTYSLHQGSLYHFVKPSHPKLLTFSVFKFSGQFSADLHLEDLKILWGLFGIQSRVANRLHSVTHAPPGSFRFLAVRHANQLKFEAVQTLKMVKAALLPGPYTFFGSGVFSFMTKYSGLANSKAFFFPA